MDVPNGSVLMKVPEQSWRLLPEWLTQRNAQQCIQGQQLMLSPLLVCLLLLDADVGQLSPSRPLTHRGPFPLSESKALSQSPRYYIPFQRLQIHFLSGCQSVESTASWADHHSEAFLKKPGFKLLIKVAFDSKSTSHLINLGERCLSQQWAQKFFHILL